MRLSKETAVRALLAILLTFGTSAFAKAQKRTAQTATPKVIECVKKADVACTSQFLATGVKANAVDEKGAPLLAIAAETKSAELIRLLLNAGADPNDVSSREATPLCRAALFGRKENVQVLLDAGAKASVICDSDHGDSALMESIRGVMFTGTPSAQETILNPEVIRESADNEKEGEENLAKLREMLTASSEDFVEIARMLLARGADVNVVAKCDVAESALMYASMAANVEMVKTLLANGADATKESPLLDLLRETEMENGRARFAALPALSRQQIAMLDWTEKTKAAREEITKLLKASGAKESALDPDEVDHADQNIEDDARESLNDVIEQNDLKDLERLVSAYSKHPLGATVLPNALRVAVIYSRVEMVKLLLASGVNSNTQSVGDTPLIQAARNDNLELVKMLVDAGADINAVDKDGRTALDAAEMYSDSSEAHRTVVAFLKERGAKSGKKKR